MINPYLFRECSAGSIPYIIRENDTLEKIGKMYNTSVKNILNYNPGINPYRLKIGQRICVPITIQIYPSCTTTNYYVVRKGDTPESIANYFNISYQQLNYSNYGINLNELYEDQVLCIPVAPSPVKIGINVKQQMLTVFRNSNKFKSYRIAPENAPNPIPRGNFTVINKQVDPGVELGARWIGLTEAGLGIHGVNTPEFIDSLSSGYSIILSNEDISDLFNLVPVGTSVIIQ